MRDGSVVSASTVCRSSTSTTSHQPLRWGPPAGADRYQLIFNGEIYNYLELRERLAREFGAAFETEGDGEAIVAGYHYLGERSCASCAACSRS